MGRWVDSLSGLLGLVEMDVVEVHPWAATVDDIEHPDLLVFNPGAGVTWEFVIESALRLRKLLQEEDLDSWPKTTGGKGLHLMVPINRDISHGAARLYCKRLANAWKRQIPLVTRPRPRRQSVTSASISITCATDAARRRSAPIPPRA